MLGEHCYMATNSIWDNYETVETKAPESSPAPANASQQSAPTNQTKQSNDIWSKYESVELPKEEGIGKQTLRYATQPMVGWTEFTAPGMIANAWQTLGTGEALAELQEWEGGHREAELRKKFPSAPWPDQPAFDEGKYMKALDEASKTIPTVSNISSFIEKQTGIPLEAHNRAQRLLRLAGGGAKIKAGGVLSKTTGAVVAPTVSAAVNALGAPEWASDLIGIGTATFSPSPKFDKIVKESGMPVRWYETLKKETKLTPNQYSKVTKAVETDVKTLTDKLIKSESKTARAMEEFPDFDDKINTLFDRVTQLSESIEETVPTSNLRGNYRRKMNNRDMKGISPDEFERAYLKESRQLYKTIPDNKNASAKQLLDQYRKNNKSFGEL